MRVLVTGATGFVGGAVALRLAREGRDVRALARPSADIKRLADAGIEVVRGDVRDRDSLALAMRGRSHVIHLAAAKSGSSALLHDVNVRGTANVMEAAREADVQRVVFGSTLGVHGFVAGTPIDERTPVRPNTLYRLTKWRGEEVVRAAHERTSAPVVIARISSVIGRGAYGWLQLAQGIAAGRMRLVGDGTNSIDLVPVSDLVDGLVSCAATPSIEGRLYVLGAGEPSTMAGFAASIAGALGVPPPGPGLPAAPFLAAQHAAALVFRVTGFASRYVHGREPLIADKRSISDLARTELGYDPHASLEDAIRAMVDGFVAAGKLPERQPR
ncbi:MAG TPA: NAD-dependent epimerase/dehydratase family protein [Gemmatimonadaceae bacterium]|nr:NAD-dependent epimerase/dehydratase family protein [Gemmatimonadaceae bacterium]